jgi:hypothetical protein
MRGFGSLILDDACVKHFAIGRAFHANLYYLANQFTTNSRYLEGTSRLLNFPYGF